MSIHSSLVRDRFLHAIPEKLKNQVIVSATTCKNIDELTTLVIEIDAIEKSMSQFNAKCTTSTQKNHNTLATTQFCRMHGWCKHKTEDCLKMKESGHTVSNSFKSSACNNPILRSQTDAGPPTTRKGSYHFRPLSSTKSTAFQSSNKPTVAACHILEEPHEFTDTAEACTQENPTVCTCLDSQSNAKYPELISLPLKLNDYEVIGHLDTGSQLSLIDISVAKQLGFPIIPTTIAMNQAQEGSSIKSIGYVHDISINFNGLLFKHDFQVICLNKQFKCLLGLDIFKKNEPIYWWNVIQ